MGDFKLKIKAIEDFDQKIVGPVLDYQKENPESKVLVLPDHPTPCALKTHILAPIPVAMIYSELKADSTLVYDEDEAKAGTFNFKTPWEMMGQFLDAHG